MKHFTWTSTLSKLALGTSLLIGCADLAQGATGDWPQWRGPNRDDISTETGLLKDWPKEGPTLLWEARGLGGKTSGYSSVSVAGGKIFTMGSFPNAPLPEPVKTEEKKDEKKDDKKGKRPPRVPLNETTAAMALDMSGKILWKTDICPTSDTGSPDWNGARSTPTVDGDRVYVLGDTGELLCLAVADGKVIWHTSLRKDLGGNVGGWAYTESPLIDGDKLICCPGGKKGTVAALDKKTGDVIWRSKDFTDSASYASLVPAEIGGVHQYVILTPASVAGIGADGAVLWKIERKGATAVIPTPVVKDNLVFVTSGYGIGGNLFKVDGSNAGFTVEQVYGGDRNMVIHHGGVVRIGDAIYGATDQKYVTCISLKDGSLLWKDESVGKGSITYADDRLYVRGEGSGDIVLLEATPTAYKEHGILKQPDRSARKAWAHLVIAGGKLYVRDQDILFCYDIKAK